MSPNNVVIIRFDVLMNTHSVIHAVSISPTNQSVFIDTTRAAPVEGTTFDFPLTPTPLWLAYLADSRLDARFPSNYQIYYPYFTVGQKYTITIGSSAADIYGDSLGTPAIFSFTPEPYFRVTNTLPMEDDTAVTPLDPSLTIRFNAPIDTGSASGAFSISPLVVGNARVYFTTWGFYWSPPSDKTLASETPYTVSIAASMKDLNGNQMNAPYSFSFTTAVYAVTSAYPSGTTVSPAAALDVYCNFLIDSTSVSPSFSISPPVTGRLTFGGSQFEFTPLPSLATNTTYTVTVSTGLRAKNGTSVKNPYTYTFATRNQ
jgi:hypothetical protein